MTELKPCPFCGGTMLRECAYNVSNIYIVECSGCETIGPARGTSVMARYAWNTRPREAALEKQVADLKAEIESGDLGEHYKSLHAAHCQTEERRAALEKALREIVNWQQAEIKGSMTDALWALNRSITDMQTIARAALGEK